MNDRAARPASGGALRIQVSYVYTNDSGEERLVARLGYGTNPVVEWRTTKTRLPPGAKAHGSATVENFRRWAVGGVRKATKADWDALAKVLWWRGLERKWARDTRKHRNRIQQPGTGR